MEWTFEFTGTFPHESRFSLKSFVSTSKRSAFRVWQSRQTGALTAMLCQRCNDRPILGARTVSSVERLPERIAQPGRLLNNSREHALDDKDASVSVQQSLAHPHSYETGLGSHRIAAPQAALIAWLRESADRAPNPTAMPDHGSRSQSGSLLPLLVESRSTPEYRRIT